LKGNEVTFHGLSENDIRVTGHSAEGNTTTITIRGSYFWVRDHPSMSFRLEFCVGSFGCRSLSVGCDVWQMVR